VTSQFGPMNLNSDHPDSGSDSVKSLFAITQLDLPEVKRAYEELDNYSVEFKSGKKTGCTPRCIIFFSSNGIYFPNTGEAVREAIFERNRYEWRRNVPESFDKVIFIRDVKKQWYLDGINSRLNTVEKVLRLLEQETKGYKIVCAGSSSGGYAAMLYGGLLGAERVVSFSGQFSLEETVRDEPLQNPLLVKGFNDPMVRQYYSLAPILFRAGVQVFHLYPRSVPADVEQVNLVVGLNNIIAYPFRYGLHGVPCYLVNCKDLFALPEHRLIRVFRSIKERDISPMAFSFKLSGILKSLPSALSEISRNMGRRTRRYFPGSQ
jgi:hypothetical protein